MLYNISTVIEIIGVFKMSSSSITIRIDANLKKDAEAIFEQMGLNFTTAYLIFTKAVVREKRIPFEISIDPFYSTNNQSYLLQAAKAMDNGAGEVHELKDDNE